MRRLIIALSYLCCLSNCLPNIVVFMADDLGFGDLGCYGNTTLQTPNIDDLCNKGMKLEHHFSTSAICSPSRAGFLTGRYPFHSGMDSGLGWNASPAIPVSFSRAGIPENQTTWPELLQKKGYNTAAIGKWHLGWDGKVKGDHKFGPLSKGFDYFFGLPWTFSIGVNENHRFFTMKRDHKALEGFLTLASLTYLFLLMERTQKSGRFLFIATTLFIGIVLWLAIEHVPLHQGDWWLRLSPYFLRSFCSILAENKVIIENPFHIENINNKMLSKAISFLEAQDQSSPFMLYFSFPNVHKPLHPHPRFIGKSRHGIYGDSVMEMDHSVGQIMKALKRLNLTSDTLVYFTADHGPAKVSPGGQNWPMRGGKFTGSLEGSLRVPGIIVWPGKIKPNSVSNVPCGHMDIFPTLHEIIGFENNTRMIDQLDGESILDVLTESKINSHDDKRIFRFYTCGQIHAIKVYDPKSGKTFKAHFRGFPLNSEGNCGGKMGFCFCNLVKEYDHLNPVVYDLDNDPAEMNPILNEEIAYLAIEEFIAAESEWHPRSQFDDFFTVFPWPDMQYPNFTHILSHL